MTELVEAQCAPRLVIRPRKSWLPLSPREIWEFRELSLRFAARDVTLRYRQTALGVGWVILQPLLGAGVLSFVFGQVAGLPAPEGVPYFLFSLVGLVGWMAFSQTAMRSSGSLIANASMVQKVFFPRLLLPLSTVLSTMVDVLVSLGLMVILLVVNATWSGLAFVTFPLWLILLICLGLGIGLVTSALAVTYRDIQHITPIAMQLLLYATPVAYALNMVPASGRWVVELNPLTGALEGFRWSILGGEPPRLALVAYASLAAAGAFLLGLLTFNRRERQFADVI